MYTFPPQLFLETNSSKLTINARSIKKKKTISPSSPGVGSFRDWLAPIFVPQWIRDASAGGRCNVQPRKDIHLEFSCFHPLMSRLFIRSNTSSFSFSSFFPPSFDFASLSVSPLPQQTPPCPCFSCLDRLILFLSLHIPFSLVSLYYQISTRRSFLPVKIPPSLLMSLCFSHSISSSFTPTYKGLFTFFHHLQSHSPLSLGSSPSSPSVSQLVPSSISSWVRKYISRNMSPISYDVFNFTSKVFPLPGSSHSPSNFPDFRHFEKLFNSRILFPSPLQLSVLISPWTSLLFVTHIRVFDSFRSFITLSLFENSNFETPDCRFDGIFGKVADDFERSIDLDACPVHYCRVDSWIN